MLLAMRMSAFGGKAVKYERRGISPAACRHYHRSRPHLFGAGGTHGSGGTHLNLKNPLPPLGRWLFRQKYLLLRTAHLETRGRGLDDVGPAFESPHLKKT
ncbi:MAG: hypothetical protein WCF55_25760, partial [Pseudolabrys sp.]